MTDGPNFPPPPPQVPGPHDLPPPGSMPPPAASGGGMAPPGGPPPRVSVVPEPDGKKPSFFTRKLWILPMWAWGGLAVIAIVVAAVLLTGGDDSPSVAPGTETSVAPTTALPATVPPVATEGSTGDSTATTEAATETTEGSTDTTAPQVPAGDLAHVESIGFTVYDFADEKWADAASYIVNDSGHALFYVEITYNFLGADGSPIATQTDYLTVLPPDGKMPSMASTYDDISANPPTSVEVTVFADQDPSYESPWTEVEVGGVTLNQDQYFSSVKGTAKNPSDKDLDYAEVRCLLVKADGTTAAGTSTYTDRVAAGQTVAWEAGTDSTIMTEVASAECRAVATLP